MNCNIAILLYIKFTYLIYVLLLTSHFNVYIVLHTSPEPSPYSSHDRIIYCNILSLFSQYMYVIFLYNDFILDHSIHQDLLKCISFPRLPTCVIDKLKMKFTNFTMNMANMHNNAFIHNTGLNEENSLTHLLDAISPDEENEAVLIEHSKYFDDLGFTKCIT